MKNKERIIWIVVTLTIVTAFIFSTASPMRAANFGNKNDGYIEDISILFNFVEANFVDEVSPQQLFEGAVKGLFESLNDPYSVFLTPEDMERFNDTTSGSFGGVGMYIHKQGGKKPEYSSDMTFREKYFDFVEVVSPIEGTPAYKAGLNAGDFIISVDNNSVEGFTTSEVADILRGKPGTSVDVTIIRKGDIKKTFSLKRAIIEVPTTKYAMLNDKTAYLKIINWTPYTSSDVSKAINVFSENNYNSLIIDVRGNPGGLLTSVVETADMFISSGTIVSTKDRNLVTLEEYKATPKVAVPSSIPIILLTDKGSASASEILAGALKDTGRAYLMGDTTYGKGSVQQIREFRDSGFKITISRYYTPGDYNIDGIGIEPNKKIVEDELTEEEIESLSTLFEENLIDDFINKNPVEVKTKTNDFIKSLNKKGIVLEDRLIRKLIRQEYNRTINDPPVFDLEYDRVLNEALNVLQSNPAGFLMEESN